MAPKKNQEKKADAAPKPKPAQETPPAAANGNGNGHAEPAAAGHASKPDQDAYKAEQDKIRAEIDALQTKLVRSSTIFSLGQSCSHSHSRRPRSRTRLRSPARMAPRLKGTSLSLLQTSTYDSRRRAALRAEQDTLRQAQGSNKMSRGKVLDQMKAINENVQKRVRLPWGALYSR